MEFNHNFQVRSPAYYPFYYSDVIGAPPMNRTRDNLITNQVLYQLSYKGKFWLPNVGSNHGPTD